MEPNGSAIVTGAGSGIGQCVAHRMQAAGWRVANFDFRDESGFDYGRRLDVSDEVAVRSAVAEAESRLGPVSAVVACAGHYEEMPLESITPETWRRMIRTHVGGVYNMMRATLPGMAARGAGSFVTIASERALVAAGGDTHYASAKAAALALTRTAALEVAARGVRVNAVAPGPTDTPLLAADSWERQPSFTETLPARRIAHPEEVALAVVALIEDGMFLDGGLISINSGTVM
ncbi:SDR family oxidoreductase [Aquibium sp. A9E412]|uniref:SDR family NAD(P)-dependent oxidoreductase n=1 Tax=Aquibium sp. A9E412 TaxID=2976767 RepID=UPI0025AF2E70|nr:SDR family oxidoreductase [Aquibium sp. A9E412]MDN2565756.1 SDR family oxidoreductase [Aquibium sp. A9E412]